MYVFLSVLYPRALLRTPYFTGLFCATNFYLFQFPILFDKRNISTGIHPGGWTTFDNQAIKQGILCGTTLWGYFVGLLCGATLRDYFAGLLCGPTLCDDFAAGPCSDH